MSKQNVNYPFGNSKEGFVFNIERSTLENDNFRAVIYTAPYSQYVLMSLKPREDIGMEIHEYNDQFIRIEAGKCLVELNGDQWEIGPSDAVVVPRGTKHNFTNIGNTPLKLYSIYSPPHHPPNLIRKLK